MLNFMLNCFLGIYSLTEQPNFSKFRNRRRNTASFQMHPKWPAESCIYEHSPWFPNFEGNSYVLTNIE